MGKGIRSYFEPAWEVVPVVLVATMLTHEIGMYPRLPARIPTHFNGAGLPDGWAAKSPLTVLLLGLICAGFYLLLTGVTFIVVYQKDILKKGRSDVPAEFEDAARREVIWLMYLMKTLMLGMFLMLDVMGMRVAMGQAHQISGVAMFGFVGAILVLVIRMAVRVSALSKAADAAMKQPGEPIV